MSAARFGVVPGPAGVDADAVVTDGLTKRFGAVTALAGCDLVLQPGRVSALIGSNGAGKTTLLQLLAGLSRPTAGSATVFGRPPGQDPAFLADVGFLAQEAPLYRRLDARAHLAIGARMNPRFDRRMAEDRLGWLGIPVDRPVATLSGGQRAQVALALALAKRPRLLLLDEPVAALDPLARREFLGALAEAVADDGVTVLMSSHLLLDLERVCDHVVLLSSSQVQLCGDIDTLLAEHRVLTAAGRRDLGPLARTHQVVSVAQTPRQTTVVVRGTGPGPGAGAEPGGAPWAGPGGGSRAESGAAPWAGPGGAPWSGPGPGPGPGAGPSWAVEGISLEELVLAYMGVDHAAAPARLSAVGGGR